MKWRRRRRQGMMCEHAAFSKCNNNNPVNLFFAGNFYQNMFKCKIDLRDTIVSTQRWAPLKMK
jgi:hypothetical protein